MRLTLQIKAILAAVTLLFCLNVSFAQVPKITLTSRTVKLDKEKLEITYSLENEGQIAIYFADNPSQLNGERGYYVSIDEANKSVKISSRVFPRLLYSSPWNKTGVELKKLGTGEISSGEISLKFPLNESIPPIEDSFKRKSIVSKEIKNIELTIGYFIEDDGLLDFLKIKPFGWFIQGQDRLFSGKFKDKSFLEIQNLLTIDVPL